MKPQERVIEETTMEKVVKVPMEERGVTEVVHFTNME